MTDDQEGQPKSAETGEVVDFSTALHELRTKHLRGLPPGAKVVLSGGANARWYFDWFEENYPGKVERHIGVEALAPKPADLPAHVEWVPSSLGDLSAVESSSVDLVFAGEVIEHLWPDDIAGLLVEAHRVLAPAGHLSLDSPNRAVTEPLAWLHPEHTLEFSVDEITALLTLAGFDEIDIRGLVLCYDRATHRHLPIDPLEGHGYTSRERLEGAADEPEDAFVWWAQARRGDRTPDPGLVRQHVRHLFGRYRPRRLQHLNSFAGIVEDVPHVGRLVRGDSGVLIHGPNAAMPAGEWMATFDLATPQQTPAGEPDVVAAALDVVTDGDRTQLGHAEVRRSEVALEPRWSRHTVRFTLNETTMGVAFRLRAEGVIPLVARFSVELLPAVRARRVTRRRALARRVKGAARRGARALRQRAGRD